jgi:hypothetical protein
MGKIYQFPPMGIYEDGLADVFKRPGYILIGWTIDYTYHHTSEELLYTHYVAYWMPETGPRWVHYHSFLSRDEAIEVSRFYNHPKYEENSCDRKDSRKHAGERLRMMTRYVHGFLVAPELLEDGPDRRREYLETHHDTATGERKEN